MAQEEEGTLAEQIVRQEYEGRLYKQFCIENRSVATNNEGVLDC